MNIAVGISDFAKIREGGYYYVDKTGLISDLLSGSMAEVMLITRPRRFGKSLGMSMLENFLNIRQNSAALFEGLSVMKDTELCHQWMNQWPTLFLSLKDIDGLNFASAKEMFQDRIAKLCKTHRYLVSSARVDPNDKKVFQKLEDLAEGHPTDAMIKTSVSLLMQMMQDHFGKRVILLIDEYDVPLAKASQNGYYLEMLDFMKGVMGTALKDNPALKFAVITGCLRIAKESIFTGTNNFVAYTISDTRLNQYFGFTQCEVDQILSDAQATAHTEEVKQWYDGYHFGDLDVYCPWDVMNYMLDLRYDPEKQPANYWENTSDNAIIRSFIDYTNAGITSQLETLLKGELIFQTVKENLTYDYLHSTEDNLWSILYAAGYLTDARQKNLPRGSMALRIPNEEVKEIFQTTIQEWFSEKARTWNRKALLHAVWFRDTETLKTEIDKLLRKTISYHDYKEDFYHAFLAGIFAGAGYRVESNQEHGNGRSDVVVLDDDTGAAAIFEVKRAKSSGTMESSCEAALQQIKEKGYAQAIADNYDTVISYGIAFYEKRCLIKTEDQGCS